MQPELQMILKQGNCREGSQSHQANYRYCFSTFKTGIGLYDSSYVVYLCRSNVTVRRG